MKTFKKLAMLFGKDRQPPAVPQGYTPITEFDGRDIFIAGYPKSGNTWFQELIGAVVHGMDPGMCSDALIQELAVDVHFKTFYKRFQTPMFFKTHFLPRPEYKRVVYLLRDGRDVMSSYYHHTAALEGTPPDFLKMVRDGEMVWPCHWHEHVEAWTANPYQADMMRIKYEDLLQDPVAALLRFCKFAGIQRDAKYLERAAQATAFEKMQRKEARLKVYFDPHWPKDKLFRRKGKAGAYRDEMPPEVLQAFLLKSGDTLRKSGYDLTSDRVPARLISHFAGGEGQGSVGKELQEELHH